MKPLSSFKSFVIVIPVCDQKALLTAFLDEVIPLCAARSQAFEMIVVDSGSTDGTQAVVAQRQKTCGMIKLFTLPKETGKGYAFKYGVKRSAGDIVLYVDLDGIASFQEILTNLHLIEEGYDIVIQEGCWAFRSETIRSICPRVYSQDAGFEQEVLFLAERMDFVIKKIPSKEKRKASLKDFLRMFLLAVQVRQWHCTPLNISDKFMTVKEMKSMYELEQDHWWFVSKKTMVASLIRKLNRRFQDILDAGCGTGGNLSVLSAFGRCTGSDIVREAIEFCVRNGATRLVRSQIENMPFKDRSFDLVTSLDVIEHVDDPEKTLEEFYRVLKDDGYAVITVPAFRFLWAEQDDALCHLRRYDRKDLIDQLQGAGFQVQKIGYFFFSTFLMVALVRKIQCLFPRRGEPKSDTGYLPPKWLNAVLKWIFQWEIKYALRFPLPFGSSLFAVVRKIPLKPRQNNAVHAKVLIHD